VKNFTSATFNATFNPPKNKEIDRWKNSDPQRLYIDAHTHRVLHGLASDVGGGTSFSPFHTMHAAYTVGRQSVGRDGHSLSAQHLWWLHTAGAAKALGLAGVCGNLAVGCEADFVVLNPQATPLLARRTAAADSLDEQLSAMIVWGDDRLVDNVVVNGRPGA
jgi:guanine deaminase